MPNKELAEKLHNPVIRKFWKRKTYPPFIDIMCDVDLAHMQLINKFDKRIRFLFCVIDIFSKYAWVIPLKDQKSITITSAFQKILDEPTCSPKKIRVDKGSDFYNRSMKSWVENVFSI